ncbi:MAG: hypothetical protein WC374_04210 [Phycisphaerae bacterium]
MSRYKLKDNCSPFDMVDGPAAGEKFVHGKIYDHVPEIYANRFDVLPEEPAQTTKNQNSEKRKVKDDDLKESLFTVHPSRTKKKEE